MLLGYHKSADARSQETSKLLLEKLEEICPAARLAQILAVRFFSLVREKKRN